MQSKLVSYAFRAFATFLIFVGILSGGVSGFHFSLVFLKFSVVVSKSFFEVIRVLEVKIKISFYGRNFPRNFSIILRIRDDEHQRREWFWYR